MFHSCLLSVLCTSCIFMGLSFFNLEKFSSMLKIQFMLLTLDFSHSLAITQGFGLFIVPHISCMFLSRVLKNMFHNLCLSGPVRLLDIQVPIFYLLHNSTCRAFPEFSNWILLIFFPNYIFISAWILFNISISLLNCVFKSWFVFIVLSGHITVFFWIS